MRDPRDWLLFKLHFVAALHQMRGAWHSLWRYALPHSPASDSRPDVPRKDERTGNERFCIRLTREAAESYRQGPPTRYPPGIGCWPQYGCPEAETCPIKAAGDCPLDAWNAKVEAGWTVDGRSEEGEL